VRIAIALLVAAGIARADATVPGAGTDAPPSPGCEELRRQAERETPRPPSPSRTRGAGRLKIAGVALPTAFHRTAVWIAVDGVVVRFACDEQHGLPDLIDDVFNAAIPAGSHTITAIVDLRSDRHNVTIKSYKLHLQRSWTFKIHDGKIAIVDVEVGDADSGLTKPPTIEFVER
jgi:hypothetical protein